MLNVAIVKMISRDLIHDVLIDYEDYHYFNSCYRWIVWNPNGRAPRIKGYRVNSKTRSKRIYVLSRVIMGLEHGDPRVVDHINGNTLDNRKENLRIATRAENSVNTKRRRKQYGYYGVYKQGDKYYSVTRAVNSEKVSFDTPEEAALEHDRLYFEKYGIYCPLNFPELFVEVSHVE